MGIDSQKIHAQDLQLIGELVSNMEVAIVQSSGYHACQKWMHGLLWFLHPSILQCVNEFHHHHLVALIYHNQFCQELSGDDTGRQCSRYLHCDQQAGKWPSLPLLIKIHQELALQTISEILSATHLI